MIGVLIALIGCATDYSFEPAEPSAVELPDVAPMVVPDPPDRDCPKAAETLLYEQVAEAFDRSLGELAELVPADADVVDKDRWQCFDRDGLATIQQVWEAADSNYFGMQRQAEAIDALDAERTDLVRVIRQRETQLESVIDAYEGQRWSIWGYRVGIVVIGLIALGQ